MADKDLKANMQFVETHKADLLGDHMNKFILVFDADLVDAYDTYVRAAEEGVRLYGIEGSFLVHCLVEQEPLNLIMEAAL